MHPDRALKIISPGLSSTIQDRGRFGWQSLGVPVSGALDREALIAANTVVGNEPTEAAIECLMTGCSLEVLTQTARFAVAADGALLEITSTATARTRRVPALESVTVSRGDRVSVRIGGPSISAYLAVEGGFDLSPVMGSRSTYVRAAIGGFEGRALRTGDVVPLVRASASSKREMTLPRPGITTRNSIRIILGPQHDAFTSESIRRLTDATYTISTSSDRMGIRLQGPKLEHIDGPDIVSDGIAPGSIQVPGNGLPIVMLADRQTTGGYTKIATVISADISALGRLAPGMEINFEVVDLAMAEHHARTRAAAVARWPTRLVPCSPSAADIQRALLDCNLVSGVVDGRWSPGQDALNV